MLAFRADPMLTGVRRRLGAITRRLGALVLRHVMHWSPRFREAETAIRHGDPERALSLMAGLVTPSARDSGGSVRRALGVLSDRFAMTATNIAMRRSRRWPIVDAAERRVSGHFIETDPRWSPRVPGPLEPLDATAPRRVVQILKESRPYRQSGYTMRSSYNVATIRDAGWEPVVLTPLGFPRSRTGRGGPAGRVHRRHPPPSSRCRAGLPH